MSTFSKLLISLRESKDLTKYALAQKAGVSKQLLSQLEADRHAPTWDTVQKLALALGVDCTAFADQSLALPVQVPARPRRRPKKELSSRKRTGKA